ncbi:hypothetical protein [Paenibacillus sp. GP183]|nr:hypothetical protein [Paenibacillus sp. GP183]SED11454.1 hypothetical protein SAMN05443246_5768 [Paenibacillus sp. GP183]
MKVFYNTTNQLSWIFGNWLVVVIHEATLEIELSFSVSAIT